MTIGRLACASALALALGCGENRTPGPSNHVIVIDIDDHGLAGLWMASAPHLKGLIARGTLAFSRVVVPTHSNQNNMAILTGQYPDGNDVPANDWLSRTGGFVSPISVAGELSVGDYAAWDTNPLRVRGDSLYGATSAVGGRSAYVGELPPFEAGANDVHLSIVGTTFQTPLGTLTVDAPTAKNILTMSFGYPSDVAAGYNYDGPPDAGETQTHFTLRDAADYVRAHGLPATMFVWDFVALDDDPTSTYGADGPQLAQIIDDYDDALGDLLTALDDKKLTASTNILFTLDHGKVDTHSQVVLGTQGGASADGQMAALVTAQGAAMGLDTSSYALLNEDGDAQIYAVVPGAGTAAGAAAQADVTHKLLALIQSGAIVGLDTTRTLTADGALGTRTFHDVRAASPNQADIVVFPQDDWTLNQVDATNTTPGPFQEHTQFPYGRHGGFSADELFVPLIMAGPAFKSGALLPHPVLHPEVAPTALATLTGAGPVALRTAARGAIRAALAGDPGETIALPADPTTARDVVLTGTGFEGTPAAPATPATNVVVIDVAGLYEDELFDDATTAAAAAGFRALAAQGTRFEDCWTESRDWPVTEYQMLSGGYPVAPFVARAEDDPTITFPPGQGLLLMPPAANRVADTTAYAAWRASTVFSPSGLYDAAAARGLTTAFIGTDDFHLLHVNPPVTTAAAAAGGLGAQLGALAAANHLGVLAVVAVGGTRTADRHNGAAQNELKALAATVTDAAQGIPNALVIITSRGATTIDDPGSDFYGPGSSRHVPLIVLGPGVRVGVVTGEPATPADLPATILYALGAATTTDVAQGTWATGTPVGGVPQPTPAAATQGRALLRAFLD